MNTDEVNTAHRRQKLNNIIKKITESQLLKIREGDPNVRSLHQERKFAINPQEQDDELNKPLSTRRLNEKELWQFRTKAATINNQMEEQCSEISSTLPEPGVSM